MLKIKLTSQKNITFSNYYYYARVKVIIGSFQADFFMHILKTILSETPFE